MIVHGPHRQGVGSKFYHAWEVELPEQVTRIQLRAKDDGAAAFWYAMGFTDDFAPNEDGSRCMSKIIIR